MDTKARDELQPLARQAVISGTGRARRPLVNPVLYSVDSKRGFAFFRKIHFWANHAFAPGVRRVAAPAWC